VTLLTSLLTYAKLLIISVIFETNVIKNCAYFYAHGNNGGDFALFVCKERKTTLAGLTNGMHLTIKLAADGNLTFFFGPLTVLNYRRV